MYKLVKSISKGKFLFLVIFALSTSLVLVPVSFASIGVKEGDWAKYEVTATAIEGSEEFLEDLGEMDLEWFRIEVESITSDTITLEITTHFLDGTEETNTVDAREVGFIGEADLKEGDPIIAPLIEVDTNINGTISREYAGVSRTVNYIELIETDELTITYRSYFDQTTGIMCEVSMSFTMDILEEHYEASVTYKLTETDMFTTSITEQDWLYPVMGIIGIVVVGAIIFVYRRSTRTIHTIPPSVT